MYSINNKRQSILEIQKALLLLGYGETHLVPLDGIFGEYTRDAVMHFQSENGLTVSGKVDYDTFSVLMEASNKSTAPNNTVVYPSNADKMGANEISEALRTVLLSSQAEWIRRDSEENIDGEDGYLNLFLLRIGDTPNGRLTRGQYLRLMRERDIELYYHL